jgi:hypothetical protein
MAINIDGNGLITLGGTASTQGRVRLSEDTDNGTNYIELTAPASVASDKTITFPDATGTVVISGTTPSLNGITFPATQVASADANTLDDYEQGTWDVTLTPGTSGSITVETGFNLGQYTKIGRLVTITFGLIVNSVASPVGTIRINLPIAMANLSERSSYGVASVLVPSSSTNVNNFVGLLEANANRISIYLGNATSIQSTAANQINGANEIYLTASYLTAD